MSKIYDLSTQLSSQMKYSVQISQNQSEQHTRSTGQNLTKTSGTSITLTNGEGDSRAKSIGVNENRGSSNGSSYDNKDTNHSQGTSSGTTTTSSTNKSHATGTSESESVGSNEGTSDATTSGDGQAVTREEINKGYEELLKHLGETQISRFRQGNSKGMFKTSLFLAAKTNAVYERLSASVRSIFQGNTPPLHRCACTVCSTEWLSSGNYYSWPMRRPASNIPTAKPFTHWSVPAMGAPSARPG